MADAKNEALFRGIQLDDKVVGTTLANKKVTNLLSAVIGEAGVEGGCEKAVGLLLYDVATTFPPSALVHRPQLLKYITTLKIKSKQQLDGAFAYLKKVGAEPVDTTKLEEEAGVGIEVSRDEIKAAVAEAVTGSKAELVEKRYHFNTGKLNGQVRGKLKWADGGVVKEEMDAVILSILGPKTAEDEKPLPKLKKEKKPKKEAAAQPAKGGGMEGAAAPAVEGEGEVRDPFSFFPSPKDNNAQHTAVHFSDGRIMRIANSKAELDKHLALTGGQVVTRFPPEPNGYLHIGHAKAMFVDFGYAEEQDGVCYLRFDDTNPEAEKQEYIDHIHEIVAWMGWKPVTVTYSSQYFQQLYDLAVELIKRGLAYVCHQTGEEIRASREFRTNSPWRDRPVEENLRLFEDMRRGMVDEGKATLRMKGDMKNENLNMLDLIAYRIKFVEHPKAGSKWCIYPSYDYTHCIVDSIENITHSLCTLEFEVRRASYYWLLEVLGMYKPHVWEYSRLNITNNVLSKRKLNALVTRGFVEGWDDPRLLTLAGLRRRGYSPNAINAFCRHIGVTRSENTVRMQVLEHFVRQDLDAHSPRVFVVLHPLKVTLRNLPAGEVREVAGKVHPRGEETYAMPFSRTLYIDRADFREVDDKSYYGLAPGKTVLLRYAFPITCVEVRKGKGGEVAELVCDYDPAPVGKPPKGVLHWVAEPRPGVEPLRAEVRLYEYLFTREDPNTVGDNWTDDLNPGSLEVVPDAMVGARVGGMKVGATMQAERVGYFVVDPDSAAAGGGRPVLTRTVTLKESVATKAARG